MQLVDLSYIVLVCYRLSPVVFTFIPKVRKKLEESHYQSMKF